MKPWLPVLTCAACLLAGSAGLASPPPASRGWTHVTMARDHYAQVSDRGDQLVVHCLGDAREIVLYVDQSTLDPALKGRPSALLAIVIDNSDQVLWVPGKLITVRDKISIGVGGPAADGLVHSIAAATRKVRTSIVTEMPRPETPHYNPTDFPVDGAATAIKAAYDGCGIPF